MANRILQTIIALGGRILPSLNNSMNRLNSMTNSVNNISSAVTGANQALELMSKIASAIPQLTGITDEFINMNARLNLINDGVLTTSELQDKVYASAQRSRGEFVAMSSTVAKLGLLAKDAFVDNGEVVEFAELIQKSFKIAGAATQEQVAGMYQLTQAMASGKLQGDEFRSIMENAPMVAQAISKFTNIPVGQLKAVSSEGVISAEIIKASIIASSDEINKKFKQMPVTFGDSMTLMKNVAMKSFGPSFIKISETLNNPKTLAALELLAQKIAQVAGKATDFITNNSDKILAFMDDVGYYLDKMFQAAKFLYDLAPYILGIYGAFVMWNVALRASMAIAVLVQIWQRAALILSLVTSVTDLMTLAQWALNAAFMANPIYWIIAAVIGLIAVGVLLYKNWDTVSVYLQNIWIFMKKTFFDYINSMIDILNWLIDKLNMIPGVKIPIVAKIQYDEQYKSLPDKLEALPEGVQGPQRLAQHGTGGNFYSPHMAIVGDMPETIVPHGNSARNRGLLADAASGVGVGMGGVNITFAPNIISSGRNVKEQLLESFDEFESRMNTLFAEGGRLSYGL